jgi:hypothetical protein
MQTICCACCDDDACVPVLTLNAGPPCALLPLMEGVRPNARSGKADDNYQLHETSRMVSSSSGSSSSSSIGGGDHSAPASPFSSDGQQQKKKPFLRRAMAAAAAMAAASASAAAYRAATSSISDSVKSDAKNRNSGSAAASFTRCAPDYADHGQTPNRFWSYLAIQIGLAVGIASFCARGEGISLLSAPRKTLQYTMGLIVS